MSDRVIASSEHNPYRQEVEESGDPEKTLDIAYRFAENLYVKDKRIKNLQKAIDEYHRRNKVLSDALDEIHTAIEKAKELIG